MRLFIDSQSTIDLSYSVNDKYTISIKDITYYVGYHNISTQLGNNIVKYNNGAVTRTIKLKDGLYSLNSYFTEIKNIINQNGDNSSNINYTYNETNGIITITSTSPYIFSITNSNTKLLGFNKARTIPSTATSDKPVNFNPFEMMCIHLKHAYNYYNGKPTDIIAKIPVTNHTFGTLVHYTFDDPQIVTLDNSTLEIYITDENGNIIDFHGMPVHYTCILEIL